MASGGQLCYGSTSLGVRRGWRRVAAENSHAITDSLGYPRSLAYHEDRKPGW